MADQLDSRAREVLKMGDSLFEKKSTFDSLCQAIALQFAPDLATFTNERDIGDEYADHLFSSYPVLANRELVNLFSSFLRPQTAEWFSIHVDDEDVDDGRAEREYLEYLSKSQRRAMYERKANFVTATKQADAFFGPFGNAVIQVTTSPERDSMLYLSFHLKDNAWAENASREIDVNHRKWCPTARQLKRLFGDKVSKSVEKACEKDPYQTFDCRHVVLPAREYHYKSRGGKEYPFVSLHVECESQTVLEEVGLEYFPYVIPRWKVLPGTVQGRSMATDIMLPDSRTMQAVIRTLREAGEKFVDPPMIAFADAIRSDIALYPGGITIADMEYDERLGEVIRPITQDRAGMPVGFEIAAALREDIRNGFFLDKIQLPQTAKDMTATEVRRRIEEHVRSASPLFEPIEQEYNQPLCEKTFEVMMKHGAFDVENMPRSLMDKDVKFTFRSPLSDMVEENEAEIFLEGYTGILLPAAEADPAQMANVNLTKATRDALRARGWKADWFNDEKAVGEMKENMARQQAAQQQAAALAQGAQIAETGARAAKSLSDVNGG